MTDDEEWWLIISNSSATLLTTDQILTIITKRKCPQYCPWYLQTRKEMFTAPPSITGKKESSLTQWCSSIVRKYDFEPQHFSVQILSNFHCSLHYWLSVSIIVFAACKSPDREMFQCSKRTLVHWNIIPFSESFADLTECKFLHGAYAWLNWGNWLHIEYQRCIQECM